jgi:hypothetical protein
MGFEKEEPCGVVLNYSFGIAPIRNTLVPQVGHVPFTAGRPFFNLVSSGSLISLFSLHFTQYAVTILKLIKFDCI